MRWSLLRAFALRIESWPNIECRKVLSGFIDYLFKNYKDQLVGTFYHNGIPFTM